MEFEMFRPVLEGALGRPQRWKGGRPPFDPVLKFRKLVVQSLHGLSLDQTEYLVRDQLSWMRFCQFGPEDRVPNANTLWDLREALVAPARWRIFSSAWTRPSRPRATRRGAARSSTRAWPRRPGSGTPRGRRRRSRMASRLTSRRPAWG
ncbi:transposase [uncultured Jannaschia sp.]|uniref:transposase n=1 Tax=uncultured Jannaschia sp. TaxID=293347 RepID=UPI00343736DB